MIIRFATLDDFPAWKVVADDVAEIFGNPIMANDPAFLDYAQRKIRQKETLVAVDKQNEQCIGFIGFSRHFNRITWFGVLEKYRNQGIGSKLLNMAVEELDSRKEITVETYRESYIPGQPARSIYMKHGFKEVDTTLFDELGNERSKFVIAARSAL